jgi:hypothetical protein
MPIPMSSSAGTRPPSSNEAIARSQGWQCTRRNRGLFHVIDVWAENESMVEILSPKPSRKAIRG